MEINIKELIGTEIITELAGDTMGKDLKNQLDLKKSFKAKHSIIRGNVYKVVMQNIPTFVSTHMVRHKIGVEHYVKSNRTDRGGTGEENRHTPVNHTMLINAESLMTLANKRLCKQASKETTEVMQEIKNKIRDIHPELSDCMHPTCVEKGMCPEYKPCNYNKTESYRVKRDGYTGEHNYISDKDLLG